MPKSKELSFIPSFAIYIYIQFSLFSKYSLNLAIGPTSKADITTIVWILSRPLSCFHSGKHICLYSTQPEWLFKYWHVSSHVTLLLKTLQKIPNSFRVNSIDFVMVFEILHDLFSSPLPLWSSFIADFPSLSLCHLRKGPTAASGPLHICCRLFSLALSGIVPSIHRSYQKFLPWLL